MQDLRLLGQARFGVYKDECEGLHPDIINKYYGTHGKTAYRHAGMTGARHPNDEEDNSDNSGSSGSGSSHGLAEQIAHDQKSQIRHEGIAVPAHSSPFDDLNSHEQQFWCVLGEVIQKDIVPEGVGLQPDEWEDGVTPEIPKYSDPL